MPIYSGKNALNSAISIWSKGLSIELRTFRLITWITLQLVLGAWFDGCYVSLKGQTQYFSDQMLLSVLAFGLVSVILLICLFACVLCQET